MTRWYPVAADSARTRADRHHIWIFGAAAIVLASAVVAVGLGVSVGATLLLVAASPALIVVAYETVGYRHEERALKQALKQAEA